jgi:3-deoxy-D-manno-octulosonate 8-phosphate phosphatase (KDO 8-P phosphatase)
MNDRLSGIPDDIVQRAARVRLVAFDVDGTLTDGRIWLDAAGNESKAFHIHDGLGLKLLEAQGITVALITARKSEVAQARGRELGLKHVYIGVEDKRACLLLLADELGLARDEIAFMGDDLPDLSAFAVAGFAVAPANGHAWLRERAHWVTGENGGEGAARALCDLILDARGLAPAVLAGFDRA